MPFSFIVGGTPSFKAWSAAAVLCSAWLVGCAQKSDPQESIEQQPMDRQVESKNAAATAKVADAEIAKKGQEPILLFMGQDSYTIDEYQRSIPEDEVEGVTLYTSVFQQATQENFPGVYAPAHWNSGIIDFQKTLKRFPKAALGIGLAFNDNPQDQNAYGQAIAAGEYDESIARFAESLRDLQRPVFLRIGFEFDGPWNQYHPSSFKAAFRHIAKILRDQNAKNVKTVWHSAVWPDKNLGGERAADYDHQRAGMLDDWYPGDDVVDVAGLSMFYRDLTVWGYTPPDTPARAQAQLLNFARAHKKPVMIAEAAPQGYQTADLKRSMIMKNELTSVSADDIWNEWYQPFFDFIDVNRDVIKYVAYINTHWDSQYMWHCIPNGQAGTPHCPSGFWGDSRVQVNALIRERWLNEVLNPSKFFQSAEQLTAK